VRPFYRAGAADADGTRRMLRRLDNWILTGSTIFRRTAFEEAGGLDEANGSFADGYLARKIAVMRGFCYAPQVVATWRVFAGGVSRQTALNPASAVDVLERIPARLARDPAFPGWYGPLFRKRWRFAVSRLATESSPINYPLMDSVAKGSSLDMWALSTLRRTFAGLPALERLATLAWLSIRLRPYRLSSLILTKMSRLFGDAGAPISKRM
jgi:hypothetical protein